MGYTSEDKPYKRGLLWVKTPEMSPGYFGDEENSKKNFDSGGYFNTGDVNIPSIPKKKRKNFFTQKKRLLSMMK